jgi:hypothetical protein
VRRRLARFTGVIRRIRLALDPRICDITLMAMDQFCELTREKLYDLVWETPMSRLAKSFGLSDVGLRKICTKRKIPTPPLGYWAKLAHGKKVRRPPLPKEESGISGAVLIFRRSGATVTPETKAEQVREIAANKRHPSIVVANERRRRLHPIAAAAARALRAAKTDHEGFKTADSIDGVSMSVSAGSVDRALRIADAIARAVEARGHRHEHHSGGARIKADGVPFDWRFHEIKDKKKHVPTKGELKAQAELEAQRVRWGLSYSRPPKAYRSWDYESSGRLSLTIRDASLPSWRREALIGAWRDRKGRRLEDYLDEAMSALVEAAVAITHRMAEEAERKRLAEEERERQRREEARRERRRRRQEYLTNLAEAHARYRRLSDFAADLRRELGVGREQPADRLFEELQLLLQATETQFSRESIEGEIDRFSLFADDDMDEFPPLSGGT